MKHIVTAEVRIWIIVDLMKSRCQLSDAEVADRVGVSERTVRRDRMNPDKIPLGRLLRYLELGSTRNQVASAIEALILGNRN
jgi:hypothetical protein